MKAERELWRSEPGRITDGVSLDFGFVIDDGLSAVVFAAFFVR